MAIDLDLDVLRTLVCAQRLGSFSRAAEVVGRSQSAISQQVRKLEEQVGAPLFRKQGRGLVPTEAGETLLAYARRLTALNDEALAAARGAAVEGALRFGLPGDVADSWLPELLGRFRRAHPGVRVEVAVDRNRLLFERLDRGEFDLVVALDGQGRDDAMPLTEAPDVWFGPAAGEAAWAPGEPIPLAVLEAPCMFRQAAIAALDRAGLSWRIAFTSPSLHGLWPALAAGLGVSLRARLSLPPGVRELGLDAGLPPLSSTRRLCLHDGGRAPGAAGERLKAIIQETISRHPG
jgi:DNA-binding transcriptional LysR family regulator